MDAGYVCAPETGKINSVNMEKSHLKGIAGSLALALVVAGCGGLGKMNKYVSTITYTVDPNPLIVQGDTVHVNVNGNFPGKYFYKKAVVELTPKSKESEYSRVEIWVRDDNSLPLRMKMYDRSGGLLKTFEAVETKRVQGSWFISKSRMVNHQQKHTTELLLEQIAVKTDMADDEFTVRALEKL